MDKCIGRGEQYVQVVHSSECPLSEVPLYTFNCTSKIAIPSFDSLPAIRVATIYCIMSFVLTSSLPLSTAVQLHHVFQEHHTRYMIFDL